MSSMLSEVHRTEVRRGKKNVMDATMNFLTNAKTHIDICTGAIRPNQGQAGNEEMARAFFEVAKRGGKLRTIGEIKKENLAYCRELMKTMEIRHLANVTSYFAVSDTEYIAIPGREEFNPAGPVLYSNEQPFVSHHQALFEMLWENAIPAGERITEIEQGIAPQKIDVLHDPQKIQEKLIALIEQARTEILVLLPTANAFRRQKKIGIVDSLQLAASQHGVRVSMLSPDSLIERTFQTFNKQNEAKYGRKLIDWTSITESASPTPVTLFIFDGKTSLIVEVKDDSQSDFIESIGPATYSTSKSTVLANVRFFERTKTEVELKEREHILLEKEKQSRRRAELLQDILSHDIRNYNQIVLTSAELLKETDPESDDQSLIDSILKATNGSSELIARAKKLGRIISQDEIKLYPVNLEASLETSRALIIKAHPERSINLSSSIVLGAQVVADDLLEEVFTNILSNSVNYTERDVVPVEIQVEEREEAILDEKERPYWKITFTDHGKGIPDNIKEKIFTRYLNTATGAGLGLSIVHALVVERYSGMVAIKDRVEGDYTKGTKVEVWLPKPL